MEPNTAEQNTNLSKGQDFTNQAEKAFFTKHNEVSVISKKTEKIATAIYMVTDFMPESEPLRRELRTSGLALISGTRRIAARSLDTHYALSDEVVRAAEDAIVLVRLASTIGLISDMNARILATELSKVKADILRHYGEKETHVATHPGYANVVLTEAMFQVAPMESRTQISYKGHEDNNGQNIVKESRPAKSETEAGKPSVPAGKLIVVAKKTDIGLKIARRNDVLNVIRRKGKVSIKDITSIMKDMGEKTVQRELFALVKEGVLLKEGSKRWSTYRIAP